MRVYIYIYIQFYIIKLRVFIYIHIYICMYNFTSKISRPTGNRAWRRWHLWITSVIQSVSNVRFRHISIFFLVLFRGNSMEFFFLIMSCCGHDVFSVLQIQNRGCNECLWIIFPRLPVEIGTVQPSNACCTAFAVVFKMSLHILM